MPWFNRTTQQYIERLSPRKMEARFGGSFVDGSGNGTSNAEWIFITDVATQLAAVIGWDTKFWENLVDDDITLMGAAARQAVLDAEAAAVIADNRAVAVAEVDDVETHIGWKDRGMIELLNKRDNYLTNRIEEMQTALLALQAGGGNAGARLNGLPNSYLTTATRPRADAVQDYKDEINSGGVDT